jgi:hypothetical protein
MSTLPSMSVVVPTRGRSASVVALVTALLEDSFLDELVVICDGDDAALHLLRGLAEHQPRLRPFGQSAQGAGAARQHGVLSARSEVVLLLDDDVVPDPGLVEGHAREHAAHPGPVLVVGALLTPRPVRRTVNSITTDMYVDDYAICVADWERDASTLLTHLWAGNLSLRRTTALEVRLDSVGMAGLYFEDQEFGLRLRSALVPAVYRPDLRVRHEHERSLSAFLVEAERQGRALPLLHRAHPDVVPAPTVVGITGRAPAPVLWCVGSSPEEGPCRGRCPAPSSSQPTSQVWCTRGDCSDCSSCCCAVSVKHAVWPRRGVTVQLVERLRASVPWHAVPLLLPAAPLTGRVLGQGPLTDTWQSCLDSWDVGAPPMGRGGLVMTDAAPAALRAVMDDGADDVLLAGPDTGRLLERAGLSTSTWEAVVADAGAVAMVPAGRAGPRPARPPGGRGAVVHRVRRLLPPTRITVATRRATGPPALLASVGAAHGYLLAGGGGPRRRPVLFGGPSGHAPTTVVKAVPASAADGEQRTRLEQDVLTRLAREGLGARVPASRGAGLEGPFRWSAESARVGRPLAHLLGRPAAAPRCLVVLDQVAAWLGLLGERTRVPVSWPARRQAPLLLGEHAHLASHLSDLEGVPGVLVHGDLGAAHNLLVDGTGWTAIDWETADWGGCP